MKRLSKVFKVFLTVGIILSAAMSIAAIFFRMHKRLQEVSDEQFLDNDDDEDTSCGGSCAECGMCGGDESDEIDLTVDEDEI